MKEDIHRRRSVEELTVEKLNKMTQNLIEHGYGDMKVCCDDSVIHEADIDRLYKERKLRIKGTLYSLDIVANANKLLKAIENAIEKYNYS